MTGSKDAQALLVPAAVFVVTALLASRDRLLFGEAGLVEALKVVAGIDGVITIRFDERDVVRHALVQQIVKAYESYQP